jgi:hypothetical protein
MDETIQELFDPARYEAVWQYLIDTVTGLGKAELAVLVVIGAGLMVAGWRIYKLSLILSALIGGAVLGASLGTLVGLDPLIPAVVVSLLCALAVMPTQKILFLFSGGAIGAIFITPVLCHFFGQNLWPVWAVVGFAVIGVLSFLLFKKIVIIATSIEGAFLITFGVYFLIFGTSAEVVGSTFNEPPPWIFIPVIVVGMAGIIIQLAWDKKRLLRAQKSKKD